MKKRNLITMVFLSIMTIGCTQDETLEAVSHNDSIINEIKKVETLFAKGTQEEKDESVYPDDGEKIETIMSYEDRLVYYDYLKRNGSDNSIIHSPISRGWDPSRPSGGLVLKPKGVRCSPYAELILVMDCEDHREKSYVSGNTGETFVDGNGNVHFFFCIVPSGNSVGGLYEDCQYFARTFDCEDSDTDNRFYYNGYRIANSDVNKERWGIEENEKGNITFFFNCKGTGSGFGRFGESSDPSRNGIIYTDDEDDNNINSYGWWAAPLVGYPDNIFKSIDHNTTMKVYF